MNFICNKKQSCGEAPLCGGAQPHAYDDQECSKCHMDKTARCVPMQPAKESKIATDAICICPRGPNTMVSCPIHGN